MLRSTCFFCHPEIFKLLLSFWDLQAPAFINLQAPALILRSTSFCSDPEIYRILVLFWDLQYKLLLPSWDLQAHALILVICLFLLVHTILLLYLWLQSTDLSEQGPVLFFMSTSSFWSKVYLTSRVDYFSTAACSSFLSISCYIKLYKPRDV